MTAPRDDRLDEAHGVLDRMKRDAEGLLASLGELRAVIERLDDEEADDGTDAG